MYGAQIGVFWFPFDLNNRKYFVSNAYKHCKKKKKERPLLTVVMVFKYFVIICHIKDVNTLPTGAGLHRQFNHLFQNNYKNVTKSSPVNVYVLYDR